MPLTLSFCCALAEDSKQWQQRRRKIEKTRISERGGLQDAVLDQTKKGRIRTCTYTAGKFLLDLFLEPNVVILHRLTCNLAFGVLDKVLDHSHFALTFYPPTKDDTISTPRVST